MSDTVVVKSKVKELVAPYKLSAEFVDALNEEVKKLLQKAMERAKANNRKTLMPRDL